MFCDKCGTQMADGEKFCPNCGASQQPTQQYAQQQPTQQYAQPTPVGGFQMGGTPATPSAAPAGIKLYDILALVSMALMVIGTILPFYTISFWGQSATVSYLYADGGVKDGIFVVIAAVVAFILFARNKDKFMAIPAGAAALILLFTMSNMPDFGEYGIGFYLIWIATIATAVLPFTPIAATKSLFKK